MFAYYIIYYYYYYLFKFLSRRQFHIFISPPFEILNKLRHRPHTDMHLQFTIHSQYLFCRVINNRVHNFFWWKILVFQFCAQLYIQLGHMTSCDRWKGDSPSLLYQPQLTSWSSCTQIVHKDMTSELLFFYSNIVFSVYTLQFTQHVPILLCY